MLKMNRKETFISVILGVIFYHGQGVSGDRDICDVQGSTYTYCDHGYHCCDGNRKCCADGVSSATVIGIVFAAIFFVSICVFCSILITKKKKLRPNQLVRPVNQQNVNISTVGQTNHNSYQNFTIPSRGQNYNSGQFYSYGQPPYGNPVPYGQTPIQPPPYSQTDTSAYPPPPEYKLEPN
ncbi:uncharacterized protein LOC132736247 [Ruditapes philippinarum]|uniref:uncharacterized protein LOC132736247 n=1 Tax=Ruditapes philippinarum TaxID=129788 RepID=UPI00295B8CC6|nr:uncharacterized protein LOC132736247 [Ruditapes philippinarum]